MPAPSGEGSRLRRAVFALRGVGLRRDGRAILAGIDWVVEAGERWVVLGPNGAGKTTLVRLLSTYATASHGIVEALGARIGQADVRALRPKIGYVSPSLVPMLPGHLTPCQLVDAAQAGALVPWYVDPAAVDRGRTRETLELVGLAGLPERAYSTYSSGEQLRIQLARALVARPRALLLDEPMASLDIGGRETLIATLSRVAAGGTDAIVVVLHRVEDIPPGFDRALLLRAGRVVDAGPIGEVLTGPGLSACFGMPLVVSMVGNRYAARPATEGQEPARSTSQSIASR